MKELWAIDPGQHNGLARFEAETGKLIEAIRIEYADLESRLSAVERNLVVRFVVEEFISRGDVTRGSRNEASKIIGIIDFVARQHGIPVTKQRPSDRLIAAKWTQVKVPKGHMPDDMSAYLHGSFYLIKNNIKPTALERQRNARHAR